MTPDTDGSVPAASGPALSADVAKRFATLQATCALHGYALSREVDGSCWVARWGHGRQLANEDAVRAWFVRATGRSAP